MNAGGGGNEVGEGNWDQVGDKRHFKKGGQEEGLLRGHWNQDARK